ncbi:MAG TPA: endonuclease [Candidatus Latescibacteria bacterium]|jgi:endonuclease/exonuclease/phosphatase family metal-dependent hydrolase|nr:endonuclease [Candidatus Latescibacterota bacterium]|tara:strand:- start:242 stop:1021 length:780 start_codon:yes stop_codon:yes gene_type:complete
MRVMTCNVRTSLAKDGDDHWARRRDFCLNVIRAQSADLLGFQELQRDQYDDLRLGLPEYTAWGMVDEPHTTSPVNAILFRTGRFSLLSQGGFWLSETPHVTGSSSWDSACVRLANWVRLRDRETGVDFRYVNTHLDHVGQTAREEQARLIVEDAAAYPARYPQLLTGDMNCDGANAALERFRQGGWKDTHAALHGDTNPDTFHGFRGADDDGSSGKIDWIFARGPVTPTASQIIREEQNGHYMSDHDFVWADVKLNTAE